MKTSIVFCAVALTAPILASQDSDNFKRLDNEDAQAAVIRYQMEDWYRRHDKSEAEAKNQNEKTVAKVMNFKVFFVSVTDKDPSNAFLRRFQDIPRAIKKVSASTINKSGMKVLDRATGRRGIVFRVGNIRWLSIDSAEADGGYFCDGRCGIWETFALKRENGKWGVTSVRIHRIS
jgi:hypothetical protein